MAFNGVLDWTTQCEPWEGWYGLIFVNPYDSSKVFRLAPDGVKVSHRDVGGNLVFADEKLLTTLITASNTYPIVRQFCGGNASHVVMAHRVLGTSTLGLVSFLRDDPTKTIVTSPFTGVFYDGGDGLWRSFSNILPQAPVWAARLDGSYAYVRFAGRSVGRVGNADSAALATYFTREQGMIPQLGGGQSIVASLRSSDGKVVSGRRVSVRILGPNGNTLFWSPGLLLDGAGRVRVLIYPLPGLTVHIHFSSTEDTGLAGSEIHFAY
jgi:hypothetical protein